MKQSIHLSVDVWAVTTFWLLWIMLLWTSAYKYLFKTLLSILLCVYSVVQLLDLMVGLCLIFGGHHAVLRTILHSQWQCAAIGNANTCLAAHDLLYILISSLPSFISMVYYCNLSFAKYRTTLFLSTPTILPWKILTMVQSNSPPTLSLHITSQTWLQKITGLLTGLTLNLNL